MYNKNLKAYKTTSLSADLAVADPHRVIQLMMQGVLERLAHAKGAIERRDFEAKAVAISKTISIINGLQDSLELSYGKIPQDLYDLYAYMKDRVMDAARDMSCAPLDEVANLMLTIKSGWDQISEVDKQKAYAEQHKGPAA